VSELRPTQAEADALIAMEKHRADDAFWDYPSLGGSVCIPLMSADKVEQFTLDLQRGRIDLLKGTYQTRSRSVIVLVRLDFGGPPHRNPDGVEVGPLHLHVYKEGYLDKWAVPVTSDGFPNLTDPWLMLQDFMEYCNVTLRPNIRRGLFV
jgi:hypothetical protein